MPTNLHTHDLIQQLKHIKEEQHLTPQRICEMLDAANCHVSLNTVKKVFAEGSEDQHFRFHDTLQPISRVLLGIYGEDKGVSEIDALHAAIRVKDELIEQRERELEECNRKLEEVREDDRRRIDYLKHQIELKDQRIDKLMSRVDVLLSQLQALLEKMP